VTKAPKALLTVREAAQVVGISVRSMRRQLHSLNRLSHGRLLVSRSVTGVTRKWWVSSGVLDQVLELQRLERAGWSLHAEVEAVTEDSKQAHERIDALDLRTEEQTRLLRAHEVRLQRSERKLLSQAKALKAFEKALALVAVGSRELANDDREDDSLTIVDQRGREFEKIGTSRAQNHHPGGP
jgi:hypothetical protein